MSIRRALTIAASLTLLLGADAAVLSPAVAHASTSTCAPATSTVAGTPAQPLPTPTQGNPCWVEGPYPFGSDGNPIPATFDSEGNPVPTDLTQYETECGEDPTPRLAWQGDFLPSGVNGNPPCYLQVTSMAFRAWNRGLAATGLPLASEGFSGAPVAYGVWLWNGTSWFADPTFPGSGACPGSTIMWAGKLDYWLVGSSTNPRTTLCRFDGVNLVWEPLTLPAATVARLPIAPNSGRRVGGITSGACYAWDNCWFFGDYGIVVHWDGQQLSDASSGVASSPWLQGDFTGAVARTDPAGNRFGFAISKASNTPQGNGAVEAVSQQPDGSLPPQLFSSEGGAFAPLNSLPASYAEPFGGTSSLQGSSTDLVAVDADPQGDTWVAGDPSAWQPNGGVPFGPAPLFQVDRAGDFTSSCGGYDTSTFSVSSTLRYEWSSLGVFPNDASALAGSSYYQDGVTFGGASVGGQTDTQTTDREPDLVHVCGQANPETETFFRRSDPFDQTKGLIPADYGNNSAVTAVAANADNDAWAATSSGQWGVVTTGGVFGGPLAPHFYRWTDGQPPDAPAGDDNETRPNLFTVSPPVYQVGPPQYVTTPGPTITTQKRGKTKKKKLKPAIYDVHDKLVPAGTSTFTLYVTFKVRRAVTVGAEALQGHTVVASTGLKHFKPHRGQLVLNLDRSHWPTGLKFVSPKSRKK